jgi:hypothetical protein
MSTEDQGHANPGSADPPTRRYFVSVYVPVRARVGRVMRFGFDLFEESVREDGRRVAVDGLLTLAQAGRLFMMVIRCCWSRRLPNGPGLTSIYQSSRSGAAIQ